MSVFSRSVNEQFLTGLFYTFGSAQAIRHLQQTSYTVRQRRLPFSLSSATVPNTLRLLVFLESPLGMNTIPRRYHLVCLLHHRQAH